MAADRIDVMAVMGRGSHALRSAGYPYEPMIEANAALAELFHDARIAARALEESTDAMNRSKGRRLAAAIARVQP